MLGLNHSQQHLHPLHSVLSSGLHAAVANNNLGPPPAQGRCPSSGPHAPHGAPTPPNGNPPQINMWPLIWNHITNLLPQLSIAKMDPLSQVFCLRWNNHRNNLLSVFDHLLQTEAFCDVTLACDGSSIKCHKMILSACSSYFQSLFMENTCEHPIVFLKDIKYNEIRAILDYMYKGEVNVAQEELPGLLKVAELLKVKGLVEEEREKLLSAAAKDGRPIISLTDSEKNNNGGSPPNGDVPKSGARNGSNKEDPRGFNMYGQGLPIWPLSGMFPGAHNLFSEGAKAEQQQQQQQAQQHANNHSPSSERRSDWGGGHKRKKTSGMNKQDHNSSPHPHHHNNSTQSPATRKDDEQPMETPQNNNRGDEPEEKHSNGSNGDKGGGIANYVPNQRLEWKRYKQYTRNDIMAAIDEVRKGMSALQASRKFGVPSRTLYDKVKKMGITTGRQMQRKSMPAYPASFPSLGGGSISDSYKDLKDNDEMNDSDMDAGRPSMVAPTFPSYMLNIMEKMKEAEGDSKGLSPMNLSNMLASANHRNSSSPGELIRPSENSLKRSSEGSAPQSPSSGEHESSSNDQESSNGGVTSSGEIRAQFMADLRRLGGGSESRRSLSEETPQTPLSPSKSPSDTADNLLPPRKRKVSQEHHLQALLTAAAVASAAEKSAENGDTSIEIKDEVVEDNNSSSPVTSAATQQ